MKFSKTLLLSGVLAASSLATTVQAAESPVTANFAVTSNYIFRGVTQTSDIAAVQGGIDYAHGSGFYVGTWMSNYSTGSQYENDIYGGYTMEIGSVGMDFGTILYRYPVGPTQSDLQEVYANFAIKDFEFGVALTISKEGNPADENDLYYWGSWSTDLKKDLSLGVLVGGYDYDAAATEDYNHYQVSLTKGDFIFALDKNDLTGDAGDLRMSISWSQGFDL